VEDENGVKHWKKVEVKLEDHVNIPNFPSGLSPQSYDNHLSNYLSKIAMEQLPHNRPLWNIHIIKYPTRNAAGNIIFKLHHSLGDGYSLMAALLSCLQRADNPSVPLTFPSLTSAPNPNLSVRGTSIFRNIPKVLRSAFNTVSDFGWSLMKSSYVEDDISLIRSGNPGVEFKPVVISTMTFSLDDIKQIKTKLRVTINDVITGIIFLGTRLYMQEGRNKLNNEHSTALVLLNTRAIREYKSVKEMHKPCAEKVWGNQFAFLHVSIPELTSLESLNPLDFVWKAQKLIQRQRNSGAIFLTARLLEWFRKFKGPEKKKIIFLGTRLYMQEGRNKLNNERSTALVLLNTRAIREYKSVKEMHKPCAEKVWGNQFAFLHVSIPELTSLESLNPLDFVWKAQKLIQRQRNSGAIFLTARLLEWFRKFKGPELSSIQLYQYLYLTHTIPYYQMFLTLNPKFNNAEN
ncbi:hypothetical protein Gotur_005537, partial [Gossypium turneri]